mgnify:CR=1 FL=1
MNGVVLGPVFRYCSKVNQRHLPMTNFQADDFTTEELLSDCLRWGLIEEHEADSLDHGQLAAILSEYNEEVSFQDFASSFYSY